ncbi:tryptophan halogenase family protein [Ferrimonas marina]|uniref:Tryptophan halogenase n=1 Tax=Ferrimonas marina TaxID=299255 RepID=A0A1M5YWB6_9GAMM|nr:tryptophan halogenase family protein [Ferrimonas marina]SHI16285.1 tryptophan halogenase [Ferrimonas marina]
MNQPPMRVVVAGGGTAGWMTAAALAKLMGKRLDVVLVESDQIGTVGVGEATIPTLHIYHRLLGLKEQDVMAATNATFKLGIQFENWRVQNESYLHSFGFLGKECWACGFHHFWQKGKALGMVSEIGDYCTEHLAAREGRFAVLPNQDYNHAYHMDATLYAKFLRKLAEQHGARRIEGKIESVTQCAESGDIQALVLENGERIDGDLFIDCTGFRALLIEQTLNTGYDDWSHWLPCDRAIAVQTKSVSNPPAYTRSIAHASGWQWRIPLQSRVGNGMVYCSKYWSDEEAKATLLANLEGELLNEPRVIQFRTGTRRQHWNRNCIAIGLASGFLEPLESTSIHLIQRSIIRLMQLLPSGGSYEAERNEFNSQTLEEMANIRDFIVLHYKATERDDSPFWQHCKRMPVPESLAHRMNMFEEAGKVFKHGPDLFGETSWVQVMMGQGIEPKSYHPIVDMMSDHELEGFLGGIKGRVTKKVSSLPPHFDFVAHYCPAKPQES